MSHPQRIESSVTLLWNPQISNKYWISDIRISDYSSQGLLYSDV